MTRPSNAARVLAFVALAAGLLATVYVFSVSLGDEDGDRGRNRVQREGGRKKQEKKQGQDGKQAAVYIVESGDTLTGIAAKTGVSVAELQDLNPGIDPQILVSGQRLKLR